MSKEYYMYAIKLNSTELHVNIISELKDVLKFIWLFWNKEKMQVMYDGETMCIYISSLHIFC